MICRKCGMSIEGWKFGSEATGWEHMEGECPEVKMPLVDDLAEVLANMVVGWEKQTGIDLAQHPEVLRVMHRYRHEREAVLNQIRWGQQVAADCALYGNAIHSRIEGEIERADP